MAVLLVRHAEDRAAAEGRFGDEGLTPRGVEQARAQGRALSQTEISLCLCSPLRRAVETARILLADRAIPLRPEPSLAEGALGKLDGLTASEAREKFPELFQRSSSVVGRIAVSGRTAPGGETRAEFLRRANAARGIVLEHLKSEPNVLIVSHGGLLNYLLQLLLALEPRDRVPFGFDHCGGVRLLTWKESPERSALPMLRFGPLVERLKP
ncbi:MAG: histidine phosphatase family protein [Myxococcota bacterium]